MPEEERAEYEEQIKRAWAEGLAEGGPGEGRGEKEIKQLAAAQAAGIGRDEAHREVQRAQR